ASSPRSGEVAQSYRDGGIMIMIHDPSVAADGDTSPSFALGRYGLKIRLQQPGRAVAQAQGQRIAIELGEGELAVRPGDAADPAREFWVVQLDVQLEVQAKAARVPVGAADQRPRLVDRHQLRVIERTFAEPDPAARLDERPQRHATCPVEDLV